MEMKIEYKHPDELIPYEKNAKLHPAEQVKHLANSIKMFGWTQPIVVDDQNVVVIGHGRLMAAKELNLDRVPVVRRDDLTEEQINACRLADNKTNESPWDFSKLEEELASLAIDGIDMSQFGFDQDTDESPSDPYTGKTNIPQYEPSEEVATLSELVRTDKTAELLDEILNSSVSEDEKSFLRMAAQRHLAFNYKKIADYYSRASEEMQELMEKSALVIIDYNDAIANGYTTLNSDIKEMFEDVEE